MAISDIYETGFDEDVQTDSSANHCPECDGLVTTNAVETVCEECGLVIDEQRIDHGPEWRTHDQDERKRTGAPLTAARHDRGLSTEIGHRTDANGNELPGRKRRQLNRLRREQSRAQWQSKAERNLGYGLSEVQRIVASLGLAESIRDQACTLFRTAQSERLCHGRSLKAVAAASVYATCRCNGLGRPRAEIVASTRCDMAGLTTAYDALNVELELPTQLVSATDRIPRLATELEVSDRVRRRALALAKRVSENGITIGCRPSGVAAGCLYLAAERAESGLSQRQIADAAGTTPNTLRKRRDELLDAGH